MTRKLCLGPHTHGRQGGKVCQHHQVVSTKNAAIHHAPDQRYNVSKPHNRNAGHTIQL